MKKSCEACHKKIEEGETYISVLRLHYSTKEEAETRIAHCPLCLDCGERTIGLAKLRRKKPHRAVQKNPRIRDPKEKEYTRLEAPA